MNVVGIKKFINVTIVLTNEKMNTSAFSYIAIFFTNFCACKL